MFHDFHDFFQEGPKFHDNSMVFEPYIIFPWWFHDFHDFHHSVRTLFLLTHFSPFFFLAKQWAKIAKIAENVQHWHYNHEIVMCSNRTGLNFRTSPSPKQNTSNAVLPIYMSANFEFNPTYAVKMLVQSSILIFQ